MKQYDAVRLEITHIGSVEDAEAYRAFLAEEGWTVRPGWDTDPIIAWADRHEVKSVPTRRALINVIRRRHADAGHDDPQSINLKPGEAVIDLTFYRAVEKQ